MNFSITHCIFCSTPLDFSDFDAQCPKCLYTSHAKIAKYEIYFDDMKKSLENIRSLFFVVDDYEVRLGVSMKNTSIVLLARPEISLVYDGLIDFDFSSIESLRGKINLLLAFQ